MSSNSETTPNSPSENSYQGQFYLVRLVEKYLSGLAKEPSDAEIIFSRCPEFFRKEAEELGKTVWILPQQQRHHPFSAIHFNDSLFFLSLTFVTSTTAIFCHPKWRIRPFLASHRFWTRFGPWAFLASQVYCLTLRQVYFQQRKRILERFEAKVKNGEDVQGRVVSKELVDHAFKIENTVAKKRVFSSSMQVREKRQLDDVFIPGVQGVLSRPASTLLSSEALKQIEDGKTPLDLTLKLASRNNANFLNEYLK